MKWRVLPSSEFSLKLAVSARQVVGDGSKQIRVTSPWHFSATRNEKAPMLAPTSSTVSPGATVAPTAKYSSTSCNSWAVETLLPRGCCKISSYMRPPLMLDQRTTLPGRDPLAHVPEVTVPKW